MIEVVIPGFSHLRLQHLVLDYNGTLAHDGRLLPGVAMKLRWLAAEIKIHVVTGNTLGRAREELAKLPVSVVTLAATAQAEDKQQYVTKLGRGSVVAIGNGRNDRKMLRAAALGIAVVQREGAAVEAIAAADLVTSDIRIAFELLTNPLRLKATLRS